MATPLDKITLKHPSGASAEVHLFGAHVTSFKDQTGQELLYLSKKSLFKLGSPIRGGIPILFPQFSDAGPLQKHGWARTSFWTVRRQGESEVVLELKSSATSLEDWPYEYELVLEIKIEYNDDLDDDVFKKNVAVLKMELDITSPDKAFYFTGGFHPYISTEDVSQVTITGLKNKEKQHLYFYDSATGRKSQEEADEVGQSITELGKREIDRIFIDSTDRVDTGKIVVEKAGGFKDLVIWNPHSEKAGKIEDMEVGDHSKFVCVEPIVFEPRGKSPFRGIMRIFRKAV